ncbi:hypothetical protein ACB094_05G158300 [Castanea mollissima]
MILEDSNQMYCLLSLPCVSVLLMALISFGGLSQFSNEAHGEKAGAGILDYVGGQPEHN